MVFLKRNLSVKNNAVPVVLMLVFSFALLFFATASSPFYGINPWADSNAFFTVGKSMANGVTIYKDLFEQKGPLLYVVHALSYLISNTSFTGVYVFEALAMFVSMLFAYKTAELFVSRPASFASAVLFAVSAVNSNCFYLGDSAEEFSLPFIMILLYSTVVYFRDTDSGSGKPMLFFINGLFAGCVLMIKFIVVGYWFGFMAAASLHMLIVKKDVKTAFKNAFIFIGGMALPLIVFSVYFMAKGGLGEFFSTYFGFNLFSYSSEKKSIFKTVIRFFGSYFRSLLKNTGMFLLSTFGCVCTVLLKPFGEKDRITKFSLVIVYVSAVFFTYIGGISLLYYYFSFSSFSIFAFIFAAGLAEKKFGAGKVGISSAALALAAAVAVTPLINIAFKTAPRTKEETVQYKISQKINSRSENPTVLCYNGLDAGIYLFDNIVPEFVYFEKQNVNYKVYPENMDEQNRYINEHLADYVVCRLYSGKTEEEYLKSLYKKNKTLKNDYELIYAQKDRIPHDAARGSCIELMFLVFELKK